MGENSGIQWTDHTFNPWLGCVRVSPGCEHCYAEARVVTRMKLPVWGPAATTPRKRTSVENWKKPLTWDRAAAKAGTRARVFCASLADVFEEHPSLDAWRTELFALIERTPHLDWQLLTKRPQNVRKMLPATWLASPRPNVWLGTTVEDKLRARQRVLHLIETPAALRFLSMEPLLEAVDVTSISLWEPQDENDPLAVLDALRGHVHGPDDVMPGRIEWVIVGGESGPGARPFNTGWARSLVAQCKTSGTPVFVKQFGARPFDGAGTVALRDSHGGEMDEWPADLRVREMPAVPA